MKNVRMIMAATMALSGPPILNMDDIPPGVIQNAPRPKRLGLRERMAAAESIEELDELVREGKTYEQASERTRKAWQATTRRKKKALGVA